MAVSTVVLGTIKTAVKTSAKKVIAEKAGDKALELLVSGTLTNTQAILINRYKSYPSKALGQFIARDLNIPINDLKKIVNTFKQTPKMLNASKGINFRGLIQKYLREELGLNPRSTIKDLYRILDEITTLPLDEDFSKKIKSLLYQIEIELSEKVDGITQKRSRLMFDINLSKYFNAKDIYTETNIILLESVLNSLTIDIERYSSGDGGDVVIVGDNSGDYNVYSKSSVLNYIREVKKDVQTALKV